MFSDVLLSLVGQQIQHLHAVFSFGDADSRNQLIVSSASSVISPL